MYLLSVPRLSASITGFLLLFSLIVTAQAPQFINFQAVARSPDNQQPLSNQAISGRFIIRSGNNQGSIVYSETFVANTNDFGVFTSKIGDNSTTQGSFEGIGWGQNSIFLEVAIDVNGGSNFEVVSNTQFVSVPYALSAETVSNPGSINLNQLGDVNNTIPGVGQVLQWDGSQWTPVTVNAGTNGVDGKTILNGTNNPSSALGTIGDFYINTNSNTLFGPKTAGGWGSGTTLVGPQGATGPAGPIGATGSQGPQGPQGPAGNTGPQGPLGAQGLQGPTGPAGPVGPAGEDGDRYSTISSNSLVISTGTKNLTVATGLSYSVGQTVIIANSVTNFMTGTVVSYNQTNGALVVNVTSINGSGTFSTWNISLNGAPGPAGPAGPAGATGNTGPQGPAGPQGPTGLAGPQGIQGPIGPAGATGPAGPQGATGPAGPQGQTGAAGRTVLNGTSNPASGVGSVGDFYINTSANTLFGPKTAGGWGSATSLVGPQGSTGPAGATGPAGPQGPQGATGPAGQTGATGPAGPQGQTGAAGAQGPAGAAGRTVLNGTSNPASGVGSVGDFYINTSANTLFGPKTAGGWGSATSLVGPAGSQGSTGATGPAGQTGATGPAGPQGQTGATGATGAQGPAGAAGRTVLNGTSNPASGIGSVGDFYINTSANTLFGPKTAGGWGSATSLVGPAGPQGPAGTGNVSGTTNFISKFTNATTVGNSSMFDNGSSVGIGVTTMPAESKLVIGAQNSVNEGGQIQLNAPGGANTVAHFIDNFENRFRIMSGNNAGSSLTRLTINNIGNVGIGTEGPNAKLHVVAGSANAIEFEGGIRVSGAAANRPAFQVTTPAVPNSTNYILITGSEIPPSGYYLRLDNQFSNNDPNCLLYITALGASAGSYSVVYNTTTSGGLTANRWYIYSGTAFGFRNFNVLIIKN